MELPPPVTRQLYSPRAIDASQIGAFVKITVDAGEGEIANVIGAAVFLGNDVLDVKCRER